MNISRHIYICKPLKETCNIFKYLAIFCHFCFINNGFGVKFHKTTGFWYLNSNITVCDLNVFPVISKQLTNLFLASRTLSQGIFFCNSWDFNFPCKHVVYFVLLDFLNNTLNCLIWVFQIIGIYNIYRLLP